MTESDSSAVLSASERRSFILRKLFSLTGVVPIGGFLVLHLWTYSSALAGQHAFERSYGARSESPHGWLLDAFLVWLPLAFHAGYGIVLSFEARPNVKRYPYARHWAYLWQRVTGVIVLAFIGYHAYEYPIQLALGNLERDQLFSKLCGSLSSTTSTGIPLVAVGYLVGIAATCYHFANGLANFCFSWGITSSRRATQRALGLAGILAIVSFALGASSVIYFATGSKLVLAPGLASDVPPPVSCEHLGEKERLGAVGLVGEGLLGEKEHAAR